MSSSFGREKEGRRRDEDLLLEIAHSDLDDLLYTPDISSRESVDGFGSPSCESWDEDDRERWTKLDDDGEGVDDRGEDVDVSVSSREVV